MQPKQPQQKKMTTDQALEILTNVASNMVGNLNDHNVTQTALKTIKEYVVDSMPVEFPVSAEPCREL